ncbi:GNAT family N-acetyltransferase [Niallia sp. 01092]|uniref:GNAT family N-acetyltransferase n=1 Tax=unclassified Niallia TaxID=2837522 RepID=UPI003FD1C44A
MESLNTERLMLRSWQETDSQDLYEYACSDLVGPYAGWAQHKSEEESKEIIKSFLMKEYTYAIVWKEENKVIGSIGIHERKPDSTLAHLKQREIGYALNPKYWGKGIVPEAVNRLIDYGFTTLELDVIWCGHFDFNHNSKRVNEKCGFTYRFQKKGILPLFNNKLVTSYYYCMFKTDYKKRAVLK